MNDILEAVKKIRIEDTKQNAQYFRHYQQLIIRELKHDEIELLNVMKHHHIGSFNHMILVAKDCEYIARAMDLNKKKIRALTIAGLFHDIGKSHIHDVILDLGGDKEMEKIWKRFHKKSNIPGNLLKTITLNEVILYKAEKSDSKKKYIDSFDEWLNERGLMSYKYTSLLIYFRHHQYKTKKFLRNVGIDPEIVELAASAHPEYFGENKRINLPKECWIVMIADKFNAMIQSEGKRTYTEALSKTEALNLIAEQLLKEYKGNIINRFPLRALRVLIKKYLPRSVIRELIPKTQREIMILRDNLKNKRFCITNRERMKEVVTNVSSLVATLTICNEFKGLLDKALLNKIKNLEIVETKLANICFN